MQTPPTTSEPRPIGPVVLKVRDRLGERELPLGSVRTVAGDAMGGNYMERARKLERRIASVWSKAGASPSPKPKPSQFRRYQSRLGRLQGPWRDAGRAISQCRNLTPEATAKGRKRPRKPLPVVKTRLTRTCSPWLPLNSNEPPEILTRRNDSRCQDFRCSSSNSMRGWRSSVRTCCRRLPWGGHLLHAFFSGNPCTRTFGC
jgi:hypothetical protein